MEHQPSEKENELTSTMDFVVPIKEIGLITRSVLEAIHQLYKPRRIIVVSAASERKLFDSLIQWWNVGITEFVGEETFFKESFNLSFDDILREYDQAREGDQREAGWWIQQLIKLGASTQIKDLSTNYVVWDGDLVPTRRWRLCEVDALGKIKYYIAILQAESRSLFNTTEYAKCMQALTGFQPLEPPAGGTFVAHHMVFNKLYVRELLELMTRQTRSTKPWPLLIMSYSRSFYRFSEYKTYATFMLRRHPSELLHHDLQLFGEGGMRFREGNAVVQDILKSAAVSHGGLSYAQIKEYVAQNWRNLPTAGKEQPAYLQLDHVYGLKGVACIPLPPSLAPRDSARSCAELKAGSGAVSRDSERSSTPVDEPIAALAHMPCQSHQPYVECVHLGKLRVESIQRHNALMRQSGASPSWLRDPRIAGFVRSVDYMTDSSAAVSDMHASTDSEDCSSSSSLSLRQPLVSRPRPSQTTTTVTRPVLAAAGADDIVQLGKSSRRPRVKPLVDATAATVSGDSRKHHPSTTAADTTAASLTRRQHKIKRMSPTK